MRTFRLAAGLLVLAAAFVQASSAAAALVTIADYQDDFQGPTPATGWSYQTNSLGAIGNSANYVNMISNLAGTQYTNTGLAVPTTGGSLLRSAKPVAIPAWARLRERRKIAT